MATDPSPHLFWITSRASGIVALVLSSVAVSFGLLMGTRAIKARGLDLRSTHEALSLSTLVALAVHAITLLGDGFLHPSVADISVPFVSGYKAWWTSLGIVAGWALAGLGLSYYLRRWIGQQRWRTLHRFTALAWLAGLAHSLGEGSDARELWFLVMTGVVAVPALLLLAGRVSGTGQRRASSRPVPDA